LAGRVSPRRSTVLAGLRRNQASGAGGARESVCLTGAAEYGSLGTTRGAATAAATRATCGESGRGDVPWKAASVASEHSALNSAGVPASCVWAGWLPSIPSDRARSASTTRYPIVRSGLPVGYGLRLSMLSEVYTRPSALAQAERRGRWRLRWLVPRTRARSWKTTGTTSSPMWRGSAWVETAPWPPSSPRRSVRDVPRQSRGHRVEGYREGSSEYTAHGEGLQGLQAPAARRQDQAGTPRLRADCRPESPGPPA
jgi:hypothetical protein